MRIETDDVMHSRSLLIVRQAHRTLHIWTLCLAPKPYLNVNGTRHYAQRNEVEKTWLAAACRLGKSAHFTGSDALLQGRPLCAVLLRLLTWHLCA